jgi:hypothetical protein
MSRRARRVALTVALLLPAAARVGSAAATGPQAVRVPSAPKPSASVQISFQPRKPLPHGGYYYAVAVLVNYPLVTGQSQPACATSSDMQITQYGYRHGDRPVRLRLTAAKSSAGGWCPGATYQGALYAVPHKPPCSALYPCLGHSALETAPCGGHVCGVVLPPERQPAPAPQPPGAPGTRGYSYPGGLPKPIDRSSRIIARFTLHFARS